MPDMWQNGLETFPAALACVQRQEITAARIVFGIAETCYSHSQSVANQIRFYRLQQEWLSANGETREKLGREMVEIAGEEIRLSIRQYQNARQGSAIAHESLNEFYCRPLLLLDKVLNCKQVTEKLSSSRQGPSA